MALASLKTLLIFLSNLVAGASRLTTVATWVANYTPPKDAHRVASATVYTRWAPRSMVLRVSCLQLASMKTWRTSSETASHDAIKTLVAPERAMVLMLTADSEMNRYDKSTNQQ